MVRTPFADENAAAAKSGINALSANGGNDWPEAVWSAVARCVDGSLVGGWRDKPTQRRIIVLGDAPGHNPEPFPGGTNSSSVLGAASTSDPPVSVDTLLVGGDIDAAATFDLLSGGTGGSAWSAATADLVDDGLNSIVDEVAATPRFPSGEVAALRPGFSFDKPAEGMAVPPRYFLLEILRFDERTWWWKRYKRIRLKPDVDGWVSRSPLKLGEYQWRLAMAQPSGSVLLPDGNYSPRTRGGLFYEDNWTQFTRLPALPGEPGDLSPYAWGFSNGGERTITYSWTSTVGADKYFLEIFRDGTLWKRITVREPRTSDTETRMVRVGGHRDGVTYSWHIQALNFDRRKPREGEWTPF